MANAALTVNLLRRKKRANASLHRPFLVSLFRRV
jgi:hypothetical protein